MEFSIFLFFLQLQQQKRLRNRSTSHTEQKQKKRETPQIEIILTKIGYIMDNNTFLYKDYTNEASNFAPLKFPLTLT